MKLLRTYASCIEAESDAERLEERGILCHVTGKYSQRFSKVFTGTMRSRLYVLIDRQYNDADLFLKNKRHRIKTGFPPKQFKNIKRKLIGSSYQTMNQVLVFTGSLAAVLLFIFFVVIVR